MSAALQINVSGQHTLHRLAELATVSWRVTHEDTDRALSIRKVTEKSNEISTVLRGLAPSKLTATAITESITVEEADQAAEERETDNAVAKWSMARIQTYSYTPYISNKKTTDPDPPKRHRTTASFSATWRDFKQLEAFVGELTREPLVEVNTVNWSITRKTREALQTAVRQAAIRNASKKAADYAAVYSNATVHPTEINDGFTPNHAIAEPVAFGGNVRAMARSAPGGAPAEPDISFEPSEVAVSANVQARFIVEMHS